ncbi:apolipoprotein L3-like [Latimeria chalumnae]|uniref:apolipoprotein L3-like n=1 Tax=Latimeria chalumnae TaxID=7897 RepID=UPI0003C13DE0
MDCDAPSDIQHCLEEISTKWVPRIEKHIRELYEIADKIDGVHKCSTIANVKASVGGVSSGTLSIIGLALAPVTAGLSTVFTAVGLGVGVASAVTSTSADITDFAVRKTNETRFKEIMKLVSEVFTEVDKCLQNMSVCIEKTKEIKWDLDKSLFADVLQVGSAVSQTGSSGRNIVKMVQNAKAVSKMKVNPALANLAEELTALSRTIRKTKRMADVKVVKKALPGASVTASKTAWRLNTVVSALFIAVDVGFIIYNSRHLHKGAKTEKAKDIRKAAKKLEKRLGEIKTICEKLEQKKSSD